MCIFILLSLNNSLIHQVKLLLAVFSSHHYILKVPHNVMKHYILEHRCLWLRISVKFHLNLRMFWFRLVRYTKSEPCYFHFVLDPHHLTKFTYLVGMIWYSEVLFDAKTFHHDFPSKLPKIPSPQQIYCVP